MRRGRGWRYRCGVSRPCGFPALFICFYMSTASLSEWLLPWLRSQQPRLIHSQPWHCPPQGFGFYLSFCPYFTFRFSLNWHKLVSPASAAVLTQNFHGACRSYPNFIPAKHQIYFTQPAPSDYQGIICPFHGRVWWLWGQAVLHLQLLACCSIDFTWPCAASLILQQQGAPC